MSSIMSSSSGGMTGIVRALLQIERLEHLQVRVDELEREVGQRVAREVEMHQMEMDARVERCERWRVALRRHPHGAALADAVVREVERAQLLARERREREAVQRVRRQVQLRQLREDALLHSTTDSEVLVFILHLTSVMAT